MYMTKLITPEGRAEQARKQRLAMWKPPVVRGYVYIIGPKWWHIKKLIPVKIGKAEVPEERLHSLQAGNWEELVIIRQSRAYVNPLLMESKIHKLFEESRIHREWFYISQDELDTITEILANESDH